MKTVTTLMAELHTLHVRHPQVNTKTVEALRAMADGIEQGKIGVRGISATTHMAVDEFPAATFEISFFDREHIAPRPGEKR